MRQFIFLLALMAMQQAKAQQAEKVLPWANVQMPMEWYKKQSDAWKKVIDANPNDANAWYNYYYANRIMNFHDHEDKRSKEVKDKAIMDIVDAMGKAIPESYEYNLIRWMVSNYDPAKVVHLKKAAALGEGRTEHFSYMINQGEIDRNIADRDLYSVKKYKANQYSTGMVNYNYNVIQGLKPNAILITAGDNDTYPIWVLQGLGIRKDITVINLYLLMIDQYREKLFKELGVEKWDNVWGNTEDSNKACQSKFEREIIGHIAANKRNLPVYIGLTAARCPDAFTMAIQDNLYLTGLTYVYSKEPVDNIAVMKRNFEKEYALDYLNHAFYTDIAADIVKRINGNYIVPMLQLFDHYNTAGDTEKREWIREKLLVVSKGTEDEAEVKKHIESK